MTKSKSTVNLNRNQTSQSIVGAGLSQAATSILVKNLSTKTVAGAQGTDPAELPVDQVTLAVLILDESGSMDPEEAMVKREFKENLEAIKASKQADQILLSVWAFNTGTRLVSSYLTLDLVDDLTDYHPGGGTALYDGILDAFTALVAYEAELKKQGILTKINVAVFTDGHDNSSNVTAGEVKKVAQELLGRENCVLSLTGFLGAEIPPLDPDDIAKSIGFPTVIKANATPTERRRAFGTWSSSVIKTSQTQIGGSQSGFFTP